jgi:gas vesicle protein/NADH:ubiquinone oxidoreductase subunit 6 (subunit J)
MLLLPSILLLLLQVIVSILLVVPVPAIRSAGLGIVGVFQIPRAAAVVRTLFGALVVLLISSIASIQSLLVRAAKAEARQIGDSLRVESALYNEFLQAFVTGASLLLVLLDHAIYVAIKEGDRLRVSHDALQRQAKNAGTEFLKLHEKSSSQVDSSARLKLQEDKAKELQQQVDSLKETISSLQAELEVRAKDKQVAETAMKNAEALKRQADGVAQEYDRLLEENDKLRSLLGRVDSKYAQVEGKKSA